MVPNARVGQTLVTLYDFSYILIFTADKSETGAEAENPVYDLHVFSESQHRKSQISCQADKKVTFQSREETKI